MINRKQYGFTIVELLIVIVVIGILAAISVVAYNGVQTRAKASVVADDLKKTEKAFKLLAIEQGRSTWWTDNTFTGSSNPSIEAIINNSNLGSYLQREPTSVGTNWVYDSDVDASSKAECNQNDIRGTGLFIRDVFDVNLVLEIDKIIDDGNIACGKLRHYENGTQISYSFSYTQEI
jgi:prepilin-type N-terminal cleavage/methylation domain-containing protein